MKTASTFPALNAVVHNRGAAPIEFLDTLVNTIRNLPDEVFLDTYRSTTEPDVFQYLAEEGVGFQYRLPPSDHELSLVVRKAFMCEVLRVLGGFESSWNWTEGRDVTNPSSNTLSTEEAGIFQCSANSMNFHPSLKACLIEATKQFDPDRRKLPRTLDIREVFIEVTKSSPSFAIEYCARLLRFTVRHHGPLLRREIVPWLQADCVHAFYKLLTQTNDTMLTEPTTPAKKIPYVIDPGHGGADSGAVGYFGQTAFFEKDIVLRVAQALHNRLSVDGRFHLELTRAGDSFPSLASRAALANRNNAKLVSIHANAGGGTGFECFTTPGQTESDKLATELLRSYAEDFGTLVGRYDTKDGDPDKEARFTVLTATKGPAVLFELGFMDRESDLKLMLEPAFPMNAANALYLGILSYEGLELPKTDPPVDPVEGGDPGTVPVEGNPPVESLAGAFLEGYEAAIQQLQIRADSTGVTMKKILEGKLPMHDLPDYYRAWVAAYDAKTYLSHPEVRKAAGLPG